MRIEHGIREVTIHGKGPVPQEFQQAFKACKAVRITYFITEYETTLAGEGSYKITMEAVGAPEVIDH